MKKSTLVLFFIITLFSKSLFAQDAGSEEVVHSPKKALIYSAVLPGAGQFYNKKYWKIPIIYGIGGLLVYNYSRYNKEYHCYLRALDPNESCSEYGANELNNDQLADRKDVVKRNRDLQVILLVLTYVINVVDANVDAHLNEFPVGDNASATINPALTPYQIDGYSKNAIGLNINLKF
jgi:hypothetical protein